MKNTRRNKEEQTQARDLAKRGNVKYTTALKAIRRRDAAMLETQGEVEVVRTPTVLAPADMPRILRSVMVTSGEVYTLNSWECEDGKTRLMFPMDATDAELEVGMAALLESDADLESLQKVSHILDEGVVIPDAVDEAIALTEPVSAAEVLEPLVGQELFGSGLTLLGVEDTIIIDNSADVEPWDAELELQIERCRMGSDDDIEAMYQDREGNASWAFINVDSGEGKDQFTNVPLILKVDDAGDYYQADDWQWVLDVESETYIRVVE